MMNDKEAMGMYRNGYSNKILMWFGDINFSVLEEGQKGNERFKVGANAKEN